MTLEAIAQEIEHLTIDERKQLVMIVLDSLTKPTAETPNKLYDIRQFYGVGAHMRDMDAQEYINQLREEWDDRP